jgi:four helix bundle protein
MERKFLLLKNINAYRISLSVSQMIWRSVYSWDRFARDTIGKQFVRAADSVSANIAEGFGRYHKKDKIHFYHYAHGSIQESLDWLLKAKIRHLISDEEYEKLLPLLQSMSPAIHQLIQYTNRKLQQ